MAQKKTSPSQTCSAELEHSRSASSDADLKPSSSAKTTSSADQSCKDIGPTSLFSTMSENSNSTATLTSSAEDFPAPTSATPAPCGESEKDLTARPADYGLKCAELLARYDPDTSSWRTSQQSFIEGWATFSQTWPRSGMMRSGTAYQLPTLAEAISATGFSLWPTPTARDYKGARLSTSQDEKGRGANNSLPDFFRSNGNWHYPPVAVVECMMGFPAEWLNCGRSEIPSTSRLSKKSDARSSKRRRNAESD